MNSTGTNLKGVIYAIISASTFGLIPLFAIPIMRSAELGTISILFYRFAFGAILMGTLGFLGGQSFRISWRDFKVLALFGVNYVATAMGLLYSYNLVPSGVATTIHSLYPITVSFIMIVLFKERKSPVLLFATAMSILGVALMCWTKGSVNYSGIFLLLVTVITYSIYIVSISRSNVKRLNPMPLNCYILGIGAVVVWIISLFTTAVEVIPNNFILKNLILLALVPTVISNICLILAVKFAGSVKTSILGAMEPATAILVGVFYFGEPFGWNGIMGFALITTSTLIVIIKGASKRE